MNCEKCEMIISKSVNEKLTDEEFYQTEIHTKNCTSCMLYLVSTYQVFSEKPNINIELDDFFDKKVMRRIRAINMCKFMHNMFGYIPKLIKI